MFVPIAVIGVGLIVQPITIIVKNRDFDWVLFEKINTFAAKIKETWN